MGKGLSVFSMENQVAVVTGGVRKYGYYFTEALAEAGATVAVTSRSLESAEELAARLRERGLRVQGYALEQSDDDSIEQFVSAVLRDHGRIDVLVNNARRVPQKISTEIDREELRRLFDVNSIGVIQMTRRVIAEMRTAGGGNIINIGSIYGIVGQDVSIYEEPDRNTSWDYPIQKGGMIAFSRQIATTQSRWGIRCNCLSLGGLRETAPDDPHFLENYGRKTPLGRMCDADDIAGPIIFLASQASSYMTGAHLVVEGGWTAW